MERAPRRWGWFIAFGAVYTVCGPGTAAPRTVRSGAHDARVKQETKGFVLWRSNQRAGLAVGAIVRGQPPCDRRR